MTTPNPARQTPTAHQAIQAVITARLSGLHFCLPGVVQSYDAATQRADVKPTVRGVLQGSRGNVVEEYPVLPNVPVAWPRAGACSMTMDLAINDHVMLVFAENSIAEWRRLGGVQTPSAFRRFDLSDAIALPVNLYPAASPIVPAPPGHMRLGYAASSIHVKPSELALGSENPTDRAATATKVEAQLQALVAALQTLLGVLSTDMTALATPTGIGALTAAAATVASAAIASVGAASTTASTKVRIDP